MSWSGALDPVRCSYVLCILDLWYDPQHRFRSAGGNLRPYRLSRARLPEEIWP